MTPAQYALTEFKAGRCPSMPVLDVAGSFYLCDGDWNILRGSKTYATKAAAEKDRSSITDRAQRRSWTA